MKNFGRRFRVIREEAGISQQDLASLIQMARPNLGKIEREETRNPGKATQERLAGGLGFSLEELLDRMSRVELPEYEPPEPDDWRLAICQDVLKLSYSEDRHRGLQALLRSWNKID